MPQFLYDLVMNDLRKANSEAKINKETKEQQLRNDIKKEIMDEIDNKTKLLEQAERGKKSMIIKKIYWYNTNSLEYYSQCDRYYKAVSEMSQYQGLNILYTKTADEYLSPGDNCGIKVSWKRRIVPAWMLSWWRRYM